MLHVSPRLSLFLVALLICGGCNTSPRSNYDLVDLVNASGTVTLDGKPLSQAVVTFEAEDGQFSYAMTNSSGGYTLQFDTEKKGVTPGKKIVRISTTRKILGLNAEEGGEEASGEGGGEEGSTPAKTNTELVPAKYNKASELTAEVTLDQTRYDFELVSK